MPGRDQEPSVQLASGTTDERDGSYNLTTLGSIFYNTDTSNVEIRHEDPSNNVGWRDLVMNNKEQIDISGKLLVDGDVSLNAHLSAVDASFQNNVDISGKLVVDGDVSFNGVNTFDDVNLKGNVYKQNGAGTLDSPFRRSVFGNTFTTINDGSKWIKIATLPATASTTVDITKVVLTGGDWTNEPMIITAWFRNRSGFKYQYKIEGNNEDNNGGTFTNVYLFARSVSGGAVDIWIFLDGISNYAVANWNIDTIDAVLYKNPSSQSSPPTAGTTLFSSGNNTSYPPNIITRQAHHSFHASWNTPSPTNYGFSQGNVFKPNFIWSNIGSCYSSTTGKFTAKIRGVYMFKFSAFTNQSSGSISRPTLYKNGVDRTISGNTISQNGNQVMAIIPLDIGDLVHSASSYGSLYLYSHYMYNQFSGSLIAPY